MKTKIGSLMLAFCLLLSICTSSASAAGNNVVHPKNGDELQAALASNTTVILEGKDYNLEYGIYASELQNLTIQGTSGTRIIVDSGEDTVLGLYNCENVTLSGLVLGHNEYLTWENLGGCSEGVLSFGNCTGVTINSCELFGCGLTGFDCWNTNLTMTNSMIRDCSDNIMGLSSGTSRFENCVFSGNGYYDPSVYGVYVYVFEGDEPANITFSNCQFLNNQNSKFINQDEKGVNVTVENCSFSGNTWGGDTASLPSVPSTTPSETPPASLSAIPTASAVLVNGVNTAFDAYNIGGANYFKLRDLAYVLNGTPKQFGVDWNAAANAISLTSGAAYVPVGGEMAAGSGAVQTPVPTSSKILLNGAEITLEAYNIGGNNYFKLRDIGTVFDFGVDWDGAANAVVIDTSKGYTPN